MRSCSARRGPARRRGTASGRRRHARHRARQRVPRGRPDRRRPGRRVPPEGEIHRRLVPRPTRRGDGLPRPRSLARYGDPPLDVAEIATLARSNGDERAAPAFRRACAARWARCSRRGCAPSRPSCLVVGGSIARAWDLLEAALPTRWTDSTGSRRSSRASARRRRAARRGAPRRRPPTPPPRCRSDAGAQVEARRLGASSRSREVTSPRDQAGGAAGAPPVQTLRVDTVDLEGPVPIRLFRAARSEERPPLRLAPRRRVGARHHEAAEPACRRSPPRRLCGRRRPLPPCAGAPVPGARSTTASPRSRWLVESGRARPRPEPRRDRRHERRSKPRRGDNASRSRERVTLDSAAQLLVYPVLAPRGSGQSRRRAAARAFFDAARRRLVLVALPRRAEDDATIRSPLRSSPTTSADCRPRSSITAEHDPLRDEGELYAETAAAGGRRVDCVRFAGVPHGFFSGTEERTTSAQRLVAAALGRAFEGAAGMIDHRPALPGRAPARYRHRRMRADREERAPAGVRSVRLRDRRRLRRSSRGNGRPRPTRSSARSTSCWTTRASRSSTSRPIPTSASS